jgi:DNA-binding IclR family transcriptional regulator
LAGPSSRLSNDSGAPVTNAATLSSSAETLQTLRRGIQILNLLSDVQRGLSVGQVATGLKIHRTNASRLLTTLQADRLVIRDGSGKFWLGPALSRYALSIAPRMREVVLPELRRLAEEFPVTGLLTIADGAEGVVLVVVEPTTTDFFVGIRAGSRHPLDSGAGGIALLAAREANDADSEDVVRARKRGYAVSRGRVNQGALGVAAAVGSGPEWLEGSVGVVTLADLKPATLGTEVMAAAKRVSAALSELHDY